MGRQSLGLLWLRPWSGCRTKCPELLVDGVYDAVADREAGLSMLLGGQQRHLGLSLGEHALQGRCFTDGLVALIGGQRARFHLAAVLAAKVGKRPSQLGLL